MESVYGSRHGGTWLFLNSRCIQIQSRYSRGSSHARLCHFLLDAGTCLFAGFFLGFLMQHTAIITRRRKPCSPISHGCEILAPARATFAPWKKQTKCESMGMNLRPWVWVLALGIG